VGFDAEPGAHTGEPGNRAGDLQMAPPWGVLGSRAGEWTGEEFGIDVGEQIGDRFVHAHRHALNAKLASAQIALRGTDELTGFA
jgi:hypothetical protein